MSIKRKIEDWKSQIFGSYEDLDKKYNALQGRELAIMAGAILDIGLAHAIEKKFRDDPDEIQPFLGMNGDGRSPAGTFGARIQLAYLLGIINKTEMQTYRAFKQIRNIFAHKVSASFGSPEVLKEIPVLVDEYYDVPIGKKADRLKEAQEIKNSLNKSIAETIFKHVFGVQAIIVHARIEQTDRMEIQRDRPSKYQMIRDALNKKKDDEV